MNKNKIVNPATATEPSDERVIDASVDVVFDHQATGKVPPDLFAQTKAGPLISDLLFSMGAVALVKGFDPVTGYAKHTYSVRVVLG